MNTAQLIALLLPQKYGFLGKSVLHYDKKPDWIMTSFCPVRSYIVQFLEIKYVTFPPGLDHLEH